MVIEKRLDKLVKTGIWETGVVGPICSYASEALYDLLK